MDTRKRGTTTDKHLARSLSSKKRRSATSRSGRCLMQVTSIRLEAELKERLRQISGEQGYQALMRNVLWQFVEQQKEHPKRGDRVLSQICDAPWKRLYQLLPSPGC